MQLVALTDALQVRLIACLLCSRRERLLCSAAAAASCAPLLPPLRAVPPACPCSGSCPSGRLLLAPRVLQHQLHISDTSTITIHQRHTTTTAGAHPRRLPRPQPGARRRRRRRRDAGARRPPPAGRLCHHVPRWPSRLLPRPPAAVLLRASSASLCCCCSPPTLPLARRSPSTTSFQRVAPRRRRPPCTCCTARATTICSTPWPADACAALPPARMSGCSRLAHCLA